MNRVRVKFCGITRIEDALAAADAGADAIGLVLTRKSKRFVEPALGREIRAALPPFVSSVILFSDDDDVWIDQCVKIVEPDYVQFHGSESRALCESSGIPYLKAIAMGGDAAIDAIIAHHPHAAGFLFDGNAPGHQGGAGLAFDWSRIPARLPKPVILAGGLTCDNVALAIGAARPYAVDVSSGIESAPGIKNAQKMRRFISEVRRVSGDTQT